LVEKRINHDIHNFLEYYDEKIGKGSRQLVVFE